MNIFNNDSSSVTGGSLSRHVAHYDLSQGFDSEDFNSLDAPVTIATGSTRFYSNFEFSDDVYVVGSALDFSRLTFGNSH